MIGGRKWPCWTQYLSTDQVLDELVSFGWIDGIRRKVDDERTMQLISPRRIEPWARTYKDRAERLIAAGRMQRPGMEERMIGFAVDSARRAK